MGFSSEFWIQICVYAIGGLVFVAINAFKIGQLEAKLATKEELREKVKERDAIVNRVYERFDEYKSECASSYVRRDMCTQLHETSKEEARRIDQEYKDFRHDIRQSVQKIYDEIGFLKETTNKNLGELKELILKK